MRDVAAVKARRAAARPGQPRSRPGTGFAFGASFRPPGTSPPTRTPSTGAAAAPRRILRIGATFDLRHRAQQQRLQRYVIQLPTVVVAHIRLSQITR